MLLSWLAGSVVLALLGPLCWRRFGYVEPRWVTEFHKRKEQSNV